METVCSEFVIDDKEAVPLAADGATADELEVFTIMPPPTRKRLRPGLSSRIQFRRQFFPNASAADWRDWRWQLANRIHNPEQIRQMLSLTPDEEAYFALCRNNLPAGITPYYMSLIVTSPANHPLRRCVIPTVQELQVGPGESDDPLNEDAHSPVPGLVHRYPDRVLFLALDACSTYCRYCTRSRIVGHGGIRPEPTRYDAAFAYIREHTEVRDVLISGGDPLIMSDEMLDYILSKLREIPHLQIIRIGTKTPAVLPQRITRNLIRVLRRYHPLWMSLHFTHPAECTADAYRACAMLADGGIPLGSQTVLLKDINDDTACMRELVHHLLQMRVRPYYLYQCDPIRGSEHFRTSVDQGVEIIRGLRGFTSGYAIPTYVIDAPGGGGKIPVMPQYIQAHEGQNLNMLNYLNDEYHYPDVFREPGAQASFTCRKSGK